MNLFRKQILRSRTGKTLLQVRCFQWQVVRCRVRTQGCRNTARLFISHERSNSTQDFTTSTRQACKLYFDFRHSCGNAASLFRNRRHGLPERNSESRLRIYVRLEFLKEKIRIAREQTKEIKNLLQISFKQRSARGLKLDCILLDPPRDSDKHQRVLGEIEGNQRNSSFQKKCFSRLISLNMVSTKHCCQRTCNSDSRFRDKLHKSLKEMLESGMKIFIPFPKPSQGIERVQRWMLVPEKILPSIRLPEIRTSVHYTGQDREVQMTSFPIP